MSNPSLPTLTQQQIAPLFDHLAQQGLVLSAAVNINQLPADVWLDTATVEGKDKGSLLLLGHGGRLFWKCYQQTEPAAVDPVDTFSATVSAQALQQHLPAVTHKQLFPAADCPVNLMALGRSLGWHTPSPLGMGINAQYGLWSAYRALWWLDAELTEQMEQGTFNVIANPLVNPNDQTLSLAADSCAQCVTQACLQACPASALTMGAMPDLQKCADFRLTENSRCAATCLARMACPVAPHQRYTAEQMAYHYDLARSQIHLFSSHAQQDRSQEHNKGSNHG